MNEDVLNSLIEQDEDFSVSKFKSKVENTFVQIKLSSITGKTEKIKHFVSDEVYNQIRSFVEYNESKNQIQMYEELNVANIDIVSIDEFENKFVLKVRLHSKAYDYLIDKSSKRVISGDTRDRKERYHMIEFTKLKNAKLFGAVRKCQSCGASMDINKTGRCNYCGSIFKLERYDWVITSLEW